jgi:hypothetical protein
MHGCEYSTSDGDVALSLDLASEVSDPNLW